MDKRYGTTWSYEWHEAFPTMISAARFGMWKFRTWDDVESFRIRKIEIRPKYTLKWW